MVSWIQAIERSWIPLNSVMSLVSNLSCKVVEIPEVLENLTRLQRVFSSDEDPTF